MEKLVSIILPAYNSEKTIAKTIESVLNQTYRNFELIIIDDGSTDDTGDICKRIIDERIKYRCISNGGVSQARNYGLNIATGEYVVFIDSDDLYNKRYVELLVGKANNGYDLVVCGYKNCGSSREEFIPNSMEYVDKIDFIGSLQESYLFNQVWNKIYRIDIIKQHRLAFNGDLSIAEDWNFNVDYLKWANKYAVIRRSLYSYRINPNGLGFSYRNDAGEIKMRIIDKMATQFDSGRNNPFIIDSYIRQYYALFSSIVDKRSGMSSKEAKKTIKEAIDSKKYDSRVKRNDMISIKSRILYYVLRSRNVYIIYCFARMANAYDRFNKGIKFGIRRS